MCALKRWCVWQRSCSIEHWKRGEQLKDCDLILGIDFFNQAIVGVVADRPGERVTGEEQKGKLSTEIQRNPQFLASYPQQRLSRHTGAYADSDLSLVMVIVQLLADGQDVTPDPIVSLNQFADFIVTIEHCRMVASS